MPCTSHPLWLVITLPLFVNCCHGLLPLLSVIRNRELRSPGIPLQQESAVSASHRNSGRSVIPAAAVLSAHTYSPLFAVVHVSELRPPTRLFFHPHMTCPSSTLSSINPTRTEPSANPDLRGERPTTNNPSHSSLVTHHSFQAVSLLPPHFPCVV
jgi:hypothetical protein